MGKCTKNLVEKTKKGLNLLGENVLNAILKKIRNNVAKVALWWLKCDDNRTLVSYNEIRYESTKNHLRLL